MRICLHDDEKIKAINPESLQVLERYKIDMVMLIIQYPYKPLLQIPQIMLLCTC